MERKTHLIVCLLFTFITTACSQKSTKETTLAFFEKIGQGKGESVGKSFYRELNGEETRTILELTHFTSQLINKYGLPTNQDSIIVDTINVKTPEDLGSGADSIRVIANYVQFGKQKEAPLPEYLVKFFYIETGGELKLLNFLIDDLTKPVPKNEDIPFISAFNFKYEEIAKFSFDFDGGRIQPSIFLRKRGDELTLKLNHDDTFDQFLQLLSVAKIDTSYRSTDMPRNNGRPSLGAISLNTKQDAFDWMIISIIEEEPNTPEVLNEYIQIMNFKYMNAANVYLIKKDRNKELNSLFELLVKSG